MLRLRSLHVASENNLFSFTTSPPTLSAHKPILLHTNNSSIHVCIHTCMPSPPWMCTNMRTPDKFYIFFPLLLPKVKNKMSTTFLFIATAPPLWYSTPQSSSPKLTNGSFHITSCELLAKHNKTKEWVLMMEKKHFISSSLQYHRFTTLSSFHIVPSFGCCFQ